MTNRDDQPRAVVLVVEDEPLLLMDAIGIVEDAGYDPIAATDADQAIEILISRTDIRIVFTDIDMPGSMDGLKLASAIRGRWPPIEIIVTCDKRKLITADLPDRGHFFAKPYSREAIAQTLVALAA